jgi:hypothetical protein
MTSDEVFAQFKTKLTNTSDQVFAQFKTKLNNSERAVVDLAETCADIETIIDKCQDHAAVMPLINQVARIRRISDMLQRS